jgi:hypothetical protein
MGGKNPLVILDDADLATAVNCAVQGAYFSTGQRCTASSRLIVTDGIHDRFVAAVAEKLASLKVDDALAPGTDIGPVVDQSQLDTDLKYVEIGCGEGAKLATGGERVKRAKDGYYLAPALFIEATNAMRIARGDLRPGRGGDSREELRRGARDGERHAVRAVLRYRDDVAQARVALSSAEAGMVMVNLPTAGVDYHVPFGGRKELELRPREQAATPPNSSRPSRPRTSLRNARVAAQGLRDECVATKIETDEGTRHAACGRRECLRARAGALRRQGSPREGTGRRGVAGVDDHGRDKELFAPDARVEARVDGPFEIYINPLAPPGQKGADDMRILALQDRKMLTFTWNAPPHLPEARAQRTYVTVRFKPISDNETLVMLHHGGWGDGGQWDQAYAYFDKAWGNVLANLQKRFAEGKPTTGPNGWQAFGR